MRKLYLTLIALLAVACLQAQDSCRAEFSVQLAAGNSAPFLLQATATPWHNQQKPVLSVCWNWGDGSPLQCSQRSTTTPPALTATHTYPLAGTYAIRVSITYDGGCSSTFTRTVLLPAPAPDTCGASFTGSVLNMSPVAQLLHFEAQPAHNHQRQVTRVCWNFGDGRDTCLNYTSTTPQPYFVNHLYSQPRTYNVCVTMTYDGGCQSTYCHNVALTVPPDSCRAFFTAAPVTAQPLGRRFVAVPWHNNGKRVTEVCWIFGDGRDTCITYPAGYNGDFAVTHTYTYAGTYTACVRIRYDGGCHSQYCAPVVLQLPPPPPPPDSNCHAGFVVLADSLLHRSFGALPQSNHRAIRVCWNFGDGADHCTLLPNPATPASLLATHDYAVPGHYAVCIRIEYEGGCVAQSCHEILVAAPGHCAVSFDKTALSDTRFLFTASTTADPGDSILSWRWTFGDGTAAFGQQAEHSFPAGGTFPVCVTTRTRRGCEARSCDTVTIHAPQVTLLTLVPNPVSTVLHANFHSTGPGAATIRILSATGLILRTETRPCYSGMNFWQFNVSALPTGYYYLVVQTDTQFAIRGFFKQ